MQIGSWLLFIALHTIKIKSFNFFKRFLVILKDSFYKHCFYQKTTTTSSELFALATTDWFTHLASHDSSLLCDQVKQQSSHVSLTPCNKTKSNALLNETWRSLIKYLFWNWHFYAGFLLPNFTKSFLWVVFIQLLQ